MKFFKYFSLILVAILLSRTCANAQTNSASQQTTTKNKVTICNIVYGGNVQHVSQDAPIILLIEDSISHQDIQVVFSKEVRKKFSYDPEKKLPDHRACISGKITDQNGSLAIIITNEKQIETSDLTSEKK